MNGQGGTGHGPAVCDGRTANTPPKRETVKQVHPTNPYSGRSEASAAGIFNVCAAQQPTPQYRSSNRHALSSQSNPKRRKKNIRNRVRLSASDCHSETNLLEVVKNCWYSHDRREPKDADGVKTSPSTKHVGELAPDKTPSQVRCCLRIRDNPGNSKANRGQGFKESHHKRHGCDHASAPIGEPTYQ